MGTRKRIWKDGGKYGLGSVVVCLLSLQRMVLVKDTWFPEPWWKLPGGSIEPADLSVESAAIRECEEETGIRLLPTEISIHSRSHRVNGVYYPNICIAKVTEEKLDTRLKFGNENGHRIMTAAFDRTEVPTMVDLLWQHRPLVNKTLKALSI